MARLDNLTRSPHRRRAALQARDNKMNLLKIDPKWNNLDGYPRFEDLVKRIDF